MRFTEQVWNVVNFGATITIKSTYSFLLGILIGVMIIAGTALLWKYRQLKIRLYQTEVRQAKYRSHFKSFLDSLPVGVVGVNRSGEIYFKNDRIKDITGLELQNLTHIRDFNCFSEAQRDWLLNQTQRRSVAQECVMFSSPEGKIKTLSLNVIAFSEEESDLPSVYLLMQDESREKLMEAMLQQQDKIHQMDRLTAGIVHEIKNPLVSIKGYVTMLAKRLDDPEFVRLALKVLPEEIDRLQLIVEDLLRYSKPSSVKKTEFVMRGLVEDVVQLFKLDLAVHRINVHIGLDNQMIAADPRSIKQVLINLFMNAIDAMPTGGELEITAQSDPGKWILIVRDTGVGMTEETLGNVFEDYFTSKENGMGIGLPVSYQIMKANGGLIRLFSRSGKGTSVFLEFPLRIASEAENL
jgi:polar amino acid transport system substrate-binding protein